MKSVSPFILICFFLLAGSCGAEISGKVVDAETGQPIEGAIVLVEWTIAKGLPGMSHSESYKVTEVVSDGRGNFLIPSVINPLVDSPNITIYKNGYVAWNNKFIFPNYTKRTDFTLKDKYIYKMEPFKREYRRVDHQTFIDDAIHAGLAMDKKQLFIKAYRGGESEQIIYNRQKGKN